VGRGVDKRVDEVDARGVGVKAFFQEGVLGVVEAQAPAPRTAGTLTVRPTPAGARIAIYDSLAAAPRVEEIAARDLPDAIEQVASRTYNLARESGGQVPYTIIREVSENLIHAGFSEVVVTILDGGNTVRFADQGPGIVDKERVFLPGFSTATADMKQHIRGVGSGLWSHFVSVRPRGSSRPPTLLPRAFPSARSRCSHSSWSSAPPDRPLSRESCRSRSPPHIVTWPPLKRRGSSSLMSRVSARSPSAA
jgi:hypothetical protein